ncbi:hypothetical protein L1049_011072 [Liquidambar formosana]|uniref:Uncharacterized protein n=1 Tax=Liquidambar formosana TaxID=63359 RepID=A0AAP0WWS4_LIQFO
MPILEDVDLISKGSVKPKYRNGHFLQISHQYSTCQRASNSQVIVFENRREHDGFELSDTGNPLEVENAADIPWQSKQGFLPFNSLEPDRPSRIEKCNLRKSLAWDSAFFTSAGVLDPEELFMINKGFKKAETHLHPWIEEDVWRSAESNSTVGTDGFSLESLETDLFEDIRASIQKSRKASYVASSGCVSGKGGHMQNIHCKFTAILSMCPLSSMPAPRRQSINTKGSERNTKEISVHLRACAAGSGEPTPFSFKPPKISGRAKSISTAPAKRASSGANHAKMEQKTATAASGLHLMGSKKPCLGNSCSVIPSSKSPNSSYSSSPTATSKTVSCFSYNSSGSASSDTTSKSPLNSLRRKIDSGNPHLAASGSNFKTPLRFSVRNKNDLGSSSLSFYTPKPPSCKSPASSMDGWSLASSSASSNISQRSNNLKTSLDTTCRGVLFDSRATQASGHAHDQSSVERESKGTRLPNQCVKTASMGTSPVSAGLSRNFKPSGLRVPSPKIGFFDVEKSMVPMLSGAMQFHSGGESTPTKIGTGISHLNAAANRTRHGKLQSARTTPNMKFASHQIGVSFPNSGRKLENTSLKVPDMSVAMTSCLTAGLKAQKNISAEMSREDCLKHGQVGAGRHDASQLGLGFSSKAEDKGTRGVLKNVKGTKSKGQVRLRANKSRSNKDRSDHSPENINQSKRGHEEVDRLCLENKLHLRHMNEKENLFDFQDQVDGLSRHVGSIDISGDMMIELKGKKGPSHTHPRGDNFENYGASILLPNNEHLRGPKEDSWRILTKCSPLSLPPTEEIIPNTRTPLAVKDSIYNRSGLFGYPAELTIENVAQKAPNFPFPKGIEKENN